LGWAYFFAGRYEEAIVAHKKELQRTPHSILTHEGLTAAYSWAGREKEARAQAAEILRINPKYSLEHRAKRLLAKHQADRERWLEGLRKAGLPETPPLPLPDKPSIAVLPFVNMSGDPEQEYFSDGITEELITALSKTPKMFVIARTSSFKYKGKEVDVRTVGRELGVRYVLEGSVRKYEKQLRITAQLVDAKTGHHLWAERYERDLKDLFALQDEITKKIITSLQIKLTEGEQVRVFAKGTNNLEAYLKFLHARRYINQFNKEDNILARQAAEQAIALDPGYPAAYYILGMTHLNDVYFRSSKSPEQSLDRAFQLAQKALSMDDSFSRAHVLLGWIYLQRRQHEKAIAEMEQALALEPNSAGSHAHLSRILTYAGRPGEAIALSKKALRLSPIPRTYHLHGLGSAYMDTGQYEEAIVACRKAIKIEPKNQWAHVILASAYSLAGRETEARAEAEEILRINPRFSLANFAKILAYKNQADTERFVEALRKAGLK
jgi:TolB-like protein/Tfp pilus assembly protein PilF